MVDPTQEYTKYIGQTNISIKLREIAPGVYALHCEGLYTSPFIATQDDFKIFQLGFTEPATSVEDLVVKLGYPVLDTVEMALSQVFTKDLTQTQQSVAMI